MPGDDREFYQLYEKLSYDKVPAFITTLGMSYIALALAQMLSAGGALRVGPQSAGSGRP